MTRGLRRSHLVLLALVAVLATAVLVAAVRARRPVPVMQRLPSALGSAPAAGEEGL